MIFKGYLTKSKEIAEMLSNALEIEKQAILEKHPRDEITINYGKLCGDASFPAMYQNCGYYHATLVVHTEVEEKYELVIA